MARLREPIVDLTLAEVIAGTLVAVTALLLLTAYAVNVAGWPIDPAVIPLLAVLEIAASLTWLRRNGGWPDISTEPLHLTLFALFSGGIGVYILLLAGPRLLPISQSPDMAHHLSLIDFIQQRRSLVYDNTLSRYIGEMTNYTPGSHILAALTAAWFHSIGIYVVHPILAFFVAVAQCTDAKVCDDQTVPLDRVAVAPRGPTLAGVLAAWTSR